MNCELACHLIDDYLEKRLSRYDCQRLERHLRECPACAREVRERPDFERSVRRALAASVQGRHLAPEASMRIIREARGNVRRGIWSKRVHLGARLAASAAAVSLVLLGVFFLLGGIPVPSSFGTITLLPIKQVALASEQAPHFTLDQPVSSDITIDVPASEERKALSLGHHDVRIEPWMLKPGETFTVTLLLHTDMPQPLDNARLDLDVSGPTGYYRFELTVKGPLPARGVSVLQITPQVLATSSRERYLISPSEIFREPGVYTVRVFLFSPVLPAAN